MATLLVAEYEDTLVIHFGTPGSRINAYTLAAALAGLADAAKAANATINPGFEIEVVVDAIAPGSFKTTIRTVYRVARNLFSGESVRAIVLSVIASVIYQHTFAPDSQVTVLVGPTEVVIQQGADRIVVPRQTYDVGEALTDTPSFRKAVTDTMRAVQEDASVEFLGLSPRDDGGPPQRIIPRRDFDAFGGTSEGPTPETREVVEHADLHILRAILERSRRRWEFTWRGMNISAPILDAAFYEDFAAHRITIAPGDVLRVRLRIRQRLLADSGVYMNEGYDVIEVIEHIPRHAQPDLGELP